jgi:hypothetical protein
MRDMRYLLLDVHHVGILTHALRDLAKYLVYALEIYPYHSVNCHRTVPRCIGLF